MCKWRCVKRVFVFNKMCLCLNVCMHIIFFGHTLCFFCCTLCFLAAHSQKCEGGLHWFRMGCHVIAICKMLAEKQTHHRFILLQTDTYNLYLKVISQFLCSWSWMTWLFIFYQASCRVLITWQPSLYPCNNCMHFW